MLALCPDSMIGKRDRALLASGFAGAFRRSELCALEVADLTEIAGRAAGADPAQQGRPGRAGGRGGDPAWLPPAPRRFSARKAGPRLITALHERYQQGAFSSALGGRREQLEQRRLRPS